MATGINPAQTIITISKKAIDFIIAQEVTSASSYESKCSHPTWPKGDSGITIGIGYDLGYNTNTQISNDWKNKVSAPDLTLLQSVAGLKGNKASVKLTSDLKKVYIPYAIAYDVFVHNTLPRFAKQALAIYPGLDQLMPDAQGALISMVFNRGNSLAGSRREEMRAIVPLVVAKDYEGIATQIDKSKRLWQDANLPGLIKRREREAQLVKNSQREYNDSELVKFPMVAIMQGS